ncbi:related to tRNA dihydrouridine synthase [Lecanosticta acicola]|uniref:Related to tRNA dihydrouridine synthase n=1 Tax=Lecanosticta acicola TaxID=111012 RepID=A0AAI8Z3W3_9PEZI|nr:related to tRNA dihydrouridine synthase [Lecanosticta acicola]
MASAAKRVPIPKNGVDYRGKIVLAPMVRSGECPSRLLALKYGADLVWGPETIDKALIGTQRYQNPVTKTVDFSRVASNGVKNPALTPEQRESIIYRLHPEREGRKLIYQIGSANPDLAVEAAKLIAPYVAGIDVNAGCPKPFSTSGGMGAALLKTPDKLCSILEALVKHVGEPNEIGISVKIRILSTPEETEALVRKLCATGITGLTVHCRTTPMRPRERAIRDQLKMVVNVCHEAGVACLMNGDVTSRDEALKLMEEYGADGAMIATAAETNPSVFRPESEGGKASWEEVVKEYVKTSMEVENRWGNTKYLLGQMIPGKQPAYKAMMATKSYSDIVNVLGNADLKQLAEDLDRRLEMGAFSKPKLTKAERKKLNKAAQQASSDKENEGKTEHSEQQKQPALTAGVKRTADQAQLDMPGDVAREMAPGTVSENVSSLAV